MTRSQEVRYVDKSIDLNKDVSNSLASHPMCTFSYGHLIRITLRQRRYVQSVSYSPSNRASTCPECRNP
ncbi:hypothetical protein BC628DRAFT_25789 [Trametes gibbosa]|nr:hypothetical protein BC628DRAFT_25789 [Trametes gibbosa]